MQTCLQFSEEFGLGRKQKKTCPGVRKLGLIPGKHACHKDQCMIEKTHNSYCLGYT